MSYASQGADPVLFEEREHVAVVTLNRPESLNAVNYALSRQLGEALERIESQPQIRVGVITGAGRAFCAGADLKAVAAGDEKPVVPGWGFAGFVQHLITKPLIAAVNGLALGGGFEIAMGCDLVVASAEATFGLPEVKRGIIAGAGGLVRLGEQIPPRIALEMALTGDPITALRAAELGFVNRVVEPAQVLEEAVALARRIAANAPLAVRSSKKVIQRVIDGTRPGEAFAWALSQTEAAVVRASADAKEGPRAFAEKRDPVWTGR
jgi:crotonobetainyl-CoA hydratase